VKVRQYMEGMLSLYRASAANHSDFFNTHACLRQRRILRADHTDGGYVCSGLHDQAGPAGNIRCMPLPQRVEHLTSLTRKLWSASELPIPH
jgi:hypothetical protein